MRKVKPHIMKSPFQRGKWACVGFGIFRESYSAKYAYECWLSAFDIFLSR